MTTAPATLRDDREAPLSGRARRHLHVQSLEESAETLISEARMVLPGVQALFGFQLMAVFSERFGSMSSSLQTLHLVATGLVALTVALVMAPAAYHRIAERGCVSQRFTDLGSALITAAMAPLALAIGFELYLLVRLVSGSPAVSVAAAAAILAVLTVCWFVVPIVYRQRRQR